MDGQGKKSLHLYLSEHSFLFKSSPSSSVSLTHMYFPNPIFSSPKWSISFIQTFSLTQMHNFHTMQSSSPHCSQTIIGCLSSPISSLHITPSANILMPNLSYPLTTLTIPSRHSACPPQVVYFYSMYSSTSLIYMSIASRRTIFLRPLSTFMDTFLSFIILANVPITLLPFTSFSVIYPFISPSLDKTVTRFLYSFISSILSTSNMILHPPMAGIVKSHFYFFPFKDHYSS